MEYMTASQAAEKWGISERWVQKILQDGRIEGATHFAHIWMIPADAEKPTDNRIKSGKYRNWQKKDTNEVNPDE